MDKYDYLFKYLLIGDYGVGKSALSERFANGVFYETPIKTTLCLDFAVRAVKVEDKIVRLQIWDTVGQDRFKNITSSYYRGTHGIMLVYDVTSMTSFQNVSTWLKGLDRYGGSDVTMILVGNKSDLNSKRVVEYSMGKEYADELGISFVETSAKSSTNVETLFMTMASEINSKIVEGKLELTEGISIFTRDSSPAYKPSPWICGCS